MQSLPHIPPPKVKPKETPRVISEKWLSEIADELENIPASQSEKITSLTLISTVALQ